MNISESQPVDALTNDFWNKNLLSALPLLFLALFLLMPSSLFSAKWLFLPLIGCSFVGKKGSLFLVLATLAIACFIMPMKEGGWLFCTAILSYGWLVMLISDEIDERWNLRSAQTKEAMGQIDLWKQRFEAQQRKFDAEKLLFLEKLQNSQQLAAEKTEQLEEISSVKDLLYKDIGQLQDSVAALEGELLRLQKAHGQFLQQKAYLMEEHKKQIKELNLLRVRAFQSSLLLKPRLGVALDGQLLSKSLLYSPAKMRK